MKDLGFELYEIKKDNSGDITYTEHKVSLKSNKIEEIKNHIISFFERKNSYYKHMEREELPKKWLKSFSDPIKEVFKTGKNKINFDYLLDTFIKDGLSPQSFSFSKRSKFLLIIYKKNEYFILSHLSVKSGLTLEENKIELSKLLFYSDTLLRYIYISKGENKKFDIVFWERQMTKKFFNFLGISDDFLNKEYSGELLFFCEKSFYSPTIPFDPQDFLQKYLNKEVEIIKNKEGYFLLLDGDQFKIKKIQIGDKIIEKIDNLGNELFLIKIAINTAIKQVLLKYKEFSGLSLPFNIGKLDIIEKRNIIEIGEEEIIKNNGNINDENIINLSLPLKNIVDDNNNVFLLDKDFFNYIINSILSIKKTIFFSFYDAYNIEIQNEYFSEVYKNSNIYFLNLSVQENLELNKIIKKLVDYVNKSDSGIIKKINILIILEVIYSKLKEGTNIKLYFNRIIDYYLVEISKLKGETFSESENNYIEYKSGLSLEIDKDWEKNIKEILKDYIVKKIKIIKNGFICIGFDETKRIIDGIKDKYFRKFNDDHINEFEKYLKEETGIAEIRIYKIPMINNKNILLIYILA